jgi:hypothetical protein
MPRTVKCQGENAAAGFGGERRTGRGEFIWDDTT